MRRLSRGGRALAVVAGFATAAALVAGPMPALATTPTITSQPTNDGAGLLGSAEFTVGAGHADNETLGYQWQYNLPILGWTPVVDGLLSGGTASGSTTPSLSLRLLTPLLNGVDFRVVVSSSAGGSVTSDPAALTVGDPPYIASARQVESRALTGGSAHLTATVTAGATPLSYAWQVLGPAGLLTPARWTNLTNGTDVSGARTNTLTLRNLTTDTGRNQYRVVVSNAVGADVSEPVTPTIGVAPTVTTPADKTAVDGTATFTSTVRGVPTPTARWQKQGTGGLWADVDQSSGTATVDGETATLRLTRLTTLDSGAQYRIVASDSYNETATSAAATLTVPGAKPRTTNPLDVSAVLGAATLGVTVSGDPIPTVQWQKRPAGGNIWTPVVGGSVSGGVAMLPLTGLTSSSNGDRYRAVVTNPLGYGFRYRAVASNGDQVATSSPAVLTVLV